MPYVKIAIRKLGSRFQAFVKPSPGIAARRVCCFRSFFGLGSWLHGYLWQLDERRVSCRC